VILTSIKNLEAIKANRESLGITFKIRGGVIKVFSDGLTAENVSHRMWEDFGIPNMIDAKN